MPIARPFQKLLRKSLFVPLFGAMSFGAMTSGAAAQSKPIFFVSGISAVQSDSVLPKIDFAANEEKRKSPALAVLYSFVLPGMGELYAERFDVGRYSLGAEAGLITALVSTIIYANSLASDYRNLARINAGITGDPSAQFYKDIANYQSSAQFNEEQLQNRDFARVYSSATWQWNSEDNRRGYRNTLINSDAAFQASSYIVIAMGVNRVLSAINAVRFIGDFNTRYPVEDTTTGLRMIPIYVPQQAALPAGLGLAFQTKF